MTTQAIAESPASVLVKNQKKVYGPKFYSEHGQQYKITATVRYDDQCGNGHNSFAITADIDEKRGGQWRDYSGGCCHDEIVKRFPELAPFIKWHLTGADEPMHYVANTVYHAGDRDCHGLKLGEFRQFKSHGKHQNGGIEGVPNWVLELPDRTERDVYATEKPAPVVCEWKPCGRTGEGKQRDFAAARSSAVWPDATDEQLSLEPEELTKLLLARLPALLAEFKRDVESLGLVF